MPLDIQERPEADRVKAFELFLTSYKGKRTMSMRQIGAELGVSAMTISRWAKVDDWNGKLNKVLAQSANTAETTTQAVKRRVRVGLLNGLDELQRITQDSKSSARDKIEAVKAIASIAIKVEAVTAGAFGKESAEFTAPLEFDDTLPEEPQWQETTEKRLEPEEIAAEASSPPLPAPPELTSPSLNSAAGLEWQLPQVDEAVAILEDLESEPEYRSMDPKP